MKSLAKLLKPPPPGPRVIQDAADAAERKYQRFASHAADCGTCKLVEPDPETGPARLLCFEGFACRVGWENAERRHAGLVEEAGPREVRAPRRRPL